VTLRRLSGRLFLSCDQLIELTRGFNVAAARVEVVVLFHARLVDPPEFWRVLYALEAWEQAAVFRRLGAASCFFTAHPSLHYMLDCHVPEELKVAKELCARAVESSSVAMHNLRIHGRPVKVPSRSLNGARRASGGRRDPYALYSLLRFLGFRAPQEVNRRGLAACLLLLLLPHSHRRRVWV